MKVVSNGYTQAQRELLKAIPANGRPITTAELVQRRQHKGWPVDFPRQGITVAMRGLMRKVANREESFRICKSRPMGPKQARYWIEYL